ncbi:MAG: hypothetical protein U1E29_18290 [Coriobacteriia bacterium]|nr:hypothetical protein [Coriobacteriia bacterium]
MAQIMREHRVSYLDITPATTATYAFMSAGFTEIGEELNPDVNKKQYVNDSQESATLRKYAPEYAFAFDRDSADTVHAFIVGLAQARSVGAAAETTLVDFLSTDVDAVTGLVDCHRQPVIVSVTTTGGGAPGEELTCSGSLIANGDPVTGSFNTATDTFTADVS